jgi:hypothetical protein
VSVKIGWIEGRKRGENVGCDDRRDIGIVDGCTEGRIDGQEIGKEDGRFVYCGERIPDGVDVGETHEGLEDG